MKKWISLFVCGVLVTSAFFFRVELKEAVLAFLKPTLPEPQSAPQFVEKKDVPSNQLAKKTPKPKELAKNKPERNLLPSSINLKVPFAPQAPFANWDMPYQEACEEAAVIMAHRFFTGETLDPKSMDEEILKMVEWEKKTFGYYEDTTAREIVRILKEYFGHTDVTVRYTFTIDDIKKEVASGRPVILPAAGRLLKNPYFRQPGPLYHALVVKGYTQNKIITNDPGTRRGADFLYDPEVLMNALHEWDPIDIVKGRPAMIVVRD